MKKRILFLTIKYLFYTILFLIALSAITLKLFFYIVVLLLSSGDDNDKDDGDYYNVLTGELDSTRHHDGIYRRNRRD